MKVEKDVPLKNLTTFRTGGPVRYLITATPDELPQAVQFAKEKKLSLVPFGGGSNILAPDSGLDAVLLRISSNELVSSEKGERVLIRVGASRVWDGVVSYAVQEGWWGIENLTSIPGTVGAAVVQNIGAYGAALEESLVSVEAYDLEKDESKVFEKEQIGFGYRTSLFKREVDRYIIHAVTLQLSTTPHPKIGYRDLTSHFDASREEPTLENIQSAVASIRAGKFPPLSKYGTAGSFFLNPVLAEEEAFRIQKMYPDMPLFSMPEGGTKVPLAWILDHVLALRGARVDGAFLWPEQPLVITAESNATTDSVLTLADRVRRLVEEKTGIHIIPEVRILLREKNFLKNTQKIK